MYLTKLFRKKTRSKKGFTLVEAMCSVIILAIVCVGVLNAVAFSREMVFSNNNREKASEKAQLVADEIIIALAGISPDDSTALGQIDTKMNNIANDNTAADTQLSTIGKVIRRDKADGFKPPSNDDEMIQYIVDPVTADTDVATDIGVRIDGGSRVSPAGTSQFVCTTSRSAIPATTRWLRFQHLLPETLSRNNCQRDRKVVK